MAGQLADYEITGKLSDDGTVVCLSATRPARLAPGPSPVTVWVMGPQARSPWATAQTRLGPAATVHDPGLPDWLEAGVSDWAERPVVWVSSADAVTSTLAASAPSGALPDRLGALAGAARGAHALHERGVLHGAICPQSVALVDRGAGARAGVLAPPSLADGQKLVAQIGYPPLAYVDPQLLRGEGGRWSDVWGLGATLHFLLTGRPPYAGLDDLPVVQALAQLMASSPVPLDGLAPAATELVGACLAVDPAARPATAAEVARRIDELAATWGVDAHA